MWNYPLSIFDIFMTSMNFFQVQFFDILEKYRSQVYDICVTHVYHI